MSQTADTLIVLAAFLGMMAGGLWIPFAIGLTGLLYIFVSLGPAGFNGIGLVAWASTANFSLSALPLFVLMAEVLLKSGLSDRIYRGLSRIVMRLPGGLLQTNIAGSAVFAAISGSSVTTAAAIGAIALPQLSARKYDPGLSAGTLAAGGTLGILIPPSNAMIIYGAFTETSVAKLFIAGIVPGLVLTALMMLLVGVYAVLKPGVAPREQVPPFDTAMALQVASDLGPFAVLIGLVLSGIYFGFMTPTEAAAVGTTLSVLIGMVWGRLDWATFKLALASTVNVTGSLMLIVVAAYIFSFAAAMAGLSQMLGAAVKTFASDQATFLIAVVVLYTVLGCLLESISLMVVTVPVIFPLVLSYGIDPVWFGIVLVVLVELGQITPPMGINLFVIQSIRKEGKLDEVIAGTLPFYALLLAMIGILWLFPDLALWLPGQMTKR